MPRGARGGEADGIIVLVGSYLSRQLEDLDRWARGRDWRARALLVLALAYVLFRHVADAEYQSIVGPLNLGLHEVGHFVFAPFGRFAAVLGGSLFQCLVPVIGMVMFRRQGDWFAIPVGLAWLGTNLCYVALYAGDAFDMKLPLVAPGGGHTVHDWNFILSELALHDWDARLYWIFRIAGLACLAAGVAGGAWICARIASPPARGRDGAAVEGVLSRR